MALAFAVMVIEGSTLGALSYVLKPLFDQVFVAGDGRGVWLLGTVIMALFVTRAAASIISKSILARVAQQTSTAMQVDLLAHLLTLDVQFYQENPPGSLMERVQGDTIAVQGVWSMVISAIGRDMVALASLFVVALMIDPVWTAAALIGAPLLIVPMVVVQKYVRRKTAAMRAQAGLRATRLDEVFHGITAIKLNRMEDYQLARFRGIVDRIVRAEVKTAIGRATLPASIDIVTGIGFFAVLMLGAPGIISGERTVGEFMSFFTAMALTFQPLRRLGDMAGAWQIAAASLERLFELFDKVPQTRPARLTPGVTPHKPVEISLQDVRFSYGDLPVLDGVSFIAEAGKVTALVGPSGAGKSTVFALITRLLEPQGGRIALGGVDVTAMDLGALRDLCSVVAQDTALFDETIRENVMLGRMDVSEAALQAALDAAHVSGFAATLPQGIDTPAGPRGSGLSGGQRQRVAIARALLRDAPVLLLDEATSALDAQAEAEVSSALARLSDGRTTLVIAHRLATVRSADKIVVMDRGRVIDQGTHGDLMTRDGLYAGLYRLQFGAGA
jgi:ATP-binding cassette subfamily B protein/subfamily B ATP-binding cassette protein MsbA